MTDPTQKPEEDIIIRTMKGDLAIPVPALPSVETKPQIPITPISKEATYKAPQAPIIPAPTTMPPILVVPLKTILPKEIPEIPTEPLYKTTPAWIKLGIIGLAVILVTLSGLYGYWKIFIQSKLPAIVNTPISTTTVPTLPTASTATTTTPIKFFNKLPHKSLTIDLPSKTPTALIQALKSETKIEETRTLIKQIKITYQGKLLTAAEFFNLMSIFTPKDFLSNYEDEFAFAYFNHNYLKQEEGIRPILILKIKNQDVAKIQMQEWEKNTLVNDAYPLFLKDFKLPKNLSSFRSYLFINQPVRYLNVNIPYASLNYSIYNDFLIFSTSSAGMFVILQDLTGQSVSFDYRKALEASINEFVK